MLQSIAIFEKKSGFDVRSVIKFQKKKEVENKKRKQNDAINEKAPSCCTCDPPMDLENRATKSVVAKCPDCGISIHRICLRSLTGCENCNEINSYN